MKSNVFMTLFICFISVRYIIGGLPVDCSTRDGLPCMIHSYQGLECTTRVFENDFPELFEDSLEIRSPKLNVSVVKRPGEKEQEQGIQILWSPYAEVGLQFLQGFEISVSGLDGNAVGTQNCFIADLRNVSWDSITVADKKHIIFGHVVWSLPEDSTYVIRIISLPGNDECDVDAGSTTRIQLISSEEINEQFLPSADWKTVVNCTVIRNQVVQVDFNLPPAKYGFHYVKVYLLLEEGEIIVDSNITNENKVIFESVAAGNYMVWVQPWDLNPFHPEKCLCKNYEGLCDPCTISSCPLLMINNHWTSSEEYVQLPDNLLDLHEIMPNSSITVQHSPTIDKKFTSVAKATLVVVFVAFIGVLICRYKGTCRNKEDIVKHPHKLDKEKTESSACDQDVLYCTPRLDAYNSPVSKSKFGSIRYEFISPDSDSMLCNSIGMSLSEQMLHVNERYFADSWRFDVQDENGSSISLDGQSV